MSYSQCCLFYWMIDSQKCLFGHSFCSAKTGTKRWLFLKFLLTESIEKQLSSVVFLKSSRLVKIFMFGHFQLIMWRIRTSLVILNVIWSLYWQTCKYEIVISGLIWMFISVGLTVSVIMRILLMYSYILKRMLTINS